MHRTTDYKQSAKYKLVVFFKEGKGNNPENSPKVFFSRRYLDKRGNEGLTALEKLAVSNYNGLYITAVIYDNQTHTELKKWVESNGQLEQRI